MDPARIASFVIDPFVVLGPVPVTPALAVAAAAVILLVILLCRSRAALRRARRRLWALDAGEDDGRLDAVLRQQAEITGRMQTMAEVFGSRQADLARSLGQRLDGLASRVGQSIRESDGGTRASLSALSERLAVIDRAQGEIRGLAGEVVKLQDILADKQARGAFGEGRMQAILADALPAGAFSLQTPLSNGKRPDCLIHMPGGAPGLVIDAKFPLEAFTAFREAPAHERGADNGRAFAARRLRRDMDVHIRAVSEKYRIAGETQDTVFLFVPSEAVFATLHEEFDDIVQKAYRERVVIVSPTLLVLAIQVVQSLSKDARMRAEAGLIQREVGLLAGDLERLDAQVRALRSHFAKAERDADHISVTTEKLMRRGDRLSAVDLGDDVPASLRATPTHPSASTP